MQESNSSSFASFFKRWVVTTLAVLVAANIVPGIHYDTTTGLLVATLLLGVLNAIVRPLLIFLSLPLLVLTLGFFLIVINALLLYAVGQMKSFHVDSFWAAILGSLIISVVSIIFNALLGNSKGRVRIQRSQPPPPAPPPPRREDGKGPVIDV